MNDEPNSGWWVAAVIAVYGGSALIVIVGLVLAALAWL